jgi:EAL domain-containing protein (putative c-di-GMP-specific phosphodiesterase class I)
MKQEKDRMKKVQTDFRNALDKEEFQVYYHPKVDIETREITGAEALCRWLKQGKIVPPMEFIPILEINTDICDLDFYMLEHVCQHIRKWLDEGRNVVRVSVNFSRKHLMDVDLLDHIISVVDKYQVPHEYIEVELTETTTDVQFRDLKRVVSGLQEQGIWTAVDDFGMGYSSLNLICDIPWNVLKVDKSFVPKDMSDAGSIMNLMFKHVISLAQDIGLECVIEGVETIDQLDVLRENHVNIAQGYFFDRPLPLEEFESRLDRKIYPED